MRTAPLMITMIVTLGSIAGCSLLTDTTDLTGGADATADAANMIVDGSTSDAMIESAAPGDSADAADAAAQDTVVFSDDFSMGSPDGGLDGSLLPLWDVYDFSGTEDPSLVIAVRAQRLELDLFSDAGGSHYEGLTTRIPYDFRGGRIIARVAKAPPAGTSADWDVSVGIAQTNLYRVLVESGTVRGIATINGAPKVEYFRTAFDPIAMAFLSLRHDKVSDEIVWETAATASGVWVQRFRVARAPTIDIAQPWLIELKAGTFQPEPSPGTVAFDDVVFSRAP